MSKLNLSHNKLTKIPSGVYNMLELHSLAASNNIITSIDDRICDLNMLNHLDLAHNKLQVMTFSIQSFIHSLKNFTRLCLAAWAF